MAKTPIRLNSLLIFIAAIILGGLIAGTTLAASEGGIGGTGSAANSKGIGGTGTPAMRGGIGGTGAPATHSGIGGTGLRPDSESAGKVLFILGQVEAQNQGQVRSLAKGDSVRAGDTLKSGTGATLQLRMADGGTIVLRPESQLAIESFAYKGIKDGSEHMALALLSGGFRAVTGEIGHLHKENYSIRTPNAKVGILGTDHETVFIPASQSGQTAAVEPGTYNHVISGATVLQDAQGKLMIKPNQTGFAALNGSSPIMLSRPLTIFGDPKINPGSGRRNDSNTDVNSANSISGTEQNSSVSTSGTEHVSNGSSSSTWKDSSGSSSGTGQNSSGSHSDSGQYLNSSSSGSGSNLSSSTSANAQNSSGWNFGTGQNSYNSISTTEPNKITQTDNLPNTMLDLNTLEMDAAPVDSGSVIVGAQMSSGLKSVGGAQAGNPNVTMLEEHDIPTFYSDKSTGFNFIANEGYTLSSGNAEVDTLDVKWGIYAGGTSFDASGKAITIDYHPFAYASDGAVPLSVVTSIGGTATFSTMKGYTQPVNEAGNLGGSVNLSVDINLGAATLTNYNLTVTDANSRTWTGSLKDASVPLATFAKNGTTLPVVSCVGCSGTASGSAAGMLIGPHAGGLISTYVLSTTTGQAVAGAAIISR